LSEFERARRELIGKAVVLSDRKAGILEGSKSAFSNKIRPKIARAASSSCEPLSGLSQARSYPGAVSEPLGEFPRSGE
jgi:hypothetical protein